ncbi:hypothetical protein ACFL2T_03345 [Elusimicrobiota bacterium]
MKKYLIFVVSILTASASYAAQPPLLGSTGFGYAGTDLVRELAADVPETPGTVRDKAEGLHLIPRCGRDSLVGHAASEAEYKEALARWTAILSAAGIKVGEPEFRQDIDLYVIPYETGDGTVIRDFFADHKQFPPQDEPALRANRDLVAGRMAEAGLKTVASYLVDVEFLLPTYAIYYLAKAEEEPEHESQVRILDRGGDIDFELMERGGVDIVQRPRTWMMVYIGPEIGMVHRIAKTREEVEEKLRKRVEWLVEQGKVIIGTRIVELEEDPTSEYKYLADIYFYQ